MAEKHIKIVKTKRAGMLGWVCWSLPLLLVGLIVFLTVTLLVENHAIRFYSAVSDGKFVSYDLTEGALGWSAQAAGYSHLHLLFMRFAFNLHLVVLRTIELVFGSSGVMRTLDVHGATSFDLLVGVNAGVDLLLSLFCLLPLWLTTTKCWKVVSVVVLSFLVLLFVGLIVVVIAGNLLLKRYISDHSLRYPFLELPSLVQGRGLQQILPWFGFVPVGFTLALLVDLGLYADVCRHYRSQQKTVGVRHPRPVKPSVPRKVKKAPGRPAKVSAAARAKIKPKPLVRRAAATPAKGVREKIFVHSFWRRAPRRRTVKTTKS